MLTKDVQDILEGVHYFLQEALPAEPLSGKLDCIRRGLVMQLEALAISYPTLRIKSSSVSNRSSLAYLAMDQTSTLPMPHLMNHHNVSGSGASTSGSSACYSNGSSGDGVMLATGGGSVGATDIAEQHLHQDEEYEDFTGENNRDSGILSADPAEQEELDDRDESEDVYMEAVEWQPFSKVIAKCEKHGVLMKRTKGLLRNLKNYHCVAVNGLLYLYMKETDERQKKTIDLLGYTCRDAIGDDIKDQRKRDAAFEIVGPGKKTHIFIARTARDKIQWLSALSRAIKTGRTKPVALPPSLQIATTASKPTRLQNTRDLPSPTKMTHLPEQQQDQDKGDSNVYYHDVAGDFMDEVYEEVGEEAYSRTKLPVPATTICLTTLSQEEDYDPVCPDEIPPLISPNSTPSKRPPDRPPLPACVQDIVKQQSVRPLPKAPIIDPDSGSDSDGFYCEIEEEIPVDAKQSEKDFTLRDLELEMSDSPIPTRTPLTNSFSDSVLAYIPSHLSKYKMTPEKSHTPPKLPARGIPFATTDDDSEYKVPVIAIIDEDYQIPPPNPIPADKSEKFEPDRNFSNISQDLQETYQVPSSNPVIRVDSTLIETVDIASPNKPSLTSKNLNRSLENISQNTSSSFKNRYKTLTPRDGYFINPSDSLEKKSSNETENKRLSQGSSVKDLIAKLNKTPNQDKAIATQENNLTSPGLEFQSQSSSKQDSISKNESDVEQKSSPFKPALPPRPLNLQTSKSLSEENENNNKSESNDKSGASSPVKDISTPWRNKTEVKKQLFGECYTAKFAFVATKPDGLSFSRGDEVFVHISKVDNGPGWWRATIKGKEGLVPKEYLKKKVEDQLT